MRKKGLKQSNVMDDKFFLSASLAQCCIYFYAVELWGDLFFKVKDLLHD